VHNDAVADYAAALKTGRPVYVLFHSLTCDPCVQISAVADAVVPAYADTVAFVNAISDDPSGQELASSFQFQYIPTSFFLAADGTVVSSYTGVLSAQEMRARLDSLVAAQ
jgi:thioredoxin-like negative regulator of GroEL